MSKGRMSRALTLTYNPVLQDFDAIPCEGCLQPTRVIWACSQGHILCGECYHECGHCQQVRCAACQKAPVARQCPCQLVPMTVAEPAVAKASAKPARTSVPRPASVPAAVEQCLERALAHLLRANDVAEHIRPLDQLLNRGQVRLVAERIEALTRMTDSKPLRDRLKQILKCLKLGRGDKIRAALIELGPSGWGPLARAIEDALEGVFTASFLRKLLELAEEQEALLLRRFAGMPLDVID